MPKKRLSWKEWQERAKAEYKPGEYVAKDMIRDWGYPAEFNQSDYKIDFDKGKPRRKSREAREENRSKANALRAAKDVVSVAEAKPQRRDTLQQVRQINQHPLSEVYGKSIVEHNVALHDSEHLKSHYGAGDPHNLSQSDPMFKLQKDLLEKLNSKGGNPFVVTVNPVTGESRLVERRFHSFDADPSHLPGFDIPLDADPNKAFNRAVANTSKLVGRNGAINFTPSIEFNAGLGTGAYKQLKQLGKASIPGLKAGVAGLALEAGVSYLATGDPYLATANTLSSPIDSGPTANVDRVGNLFVDRTTNQVLPSTKAEAAKGKTGLAYRNGKPVAVPYGSVAGEKSNLALVQDAMQTAVNNAKSTWIVNGRNSAQARTRAGSFEVGLGSIKFKLPELGVSELIGLNHK